MTQALPLTTAQQEVIDRVVNRLLDLAGTPPQDTDNKIPNDQDLHVISLLGGRGAGKSTLLREIERQLPKEMARRGWMENLPIRVCDTIDCSTQPEDFAPGFTVMVQLLDWFKEEIKKPNISPIHSGFIGDPDEILVKFAGNLPHFFDLGLQTASGYHEYAHYAKTGVQHRLKLRKTVSGALKTMCKKLGSKVILVPLDDFDLVHQAQVLPWLKAFADELNQSQLIFLLTADLYRLERLSYGPDSFDEKTGRAILAKYLRIQNRFHLPDFNRDNRLSFKPHEYKNDTNAHELKDLLEELLLVSTCTAGLKQTFNALLPRHPRGLESLYHTWLERYKSIQAATATATRESPESPESPESQQNSAETSLKAHRNLSSLLQELATARNESLLARRIDEVSVLDWPDKLNFDQESLSPERWQSSTELALERGRAVSDKSKKGGFRSHPDGFPGLTTTMDMREISGLSPKAQSGSPDSSVLINLTAALNSHEQQGPEWREPILDPLAHKRPLRDALVRQRAVWAELLMDIGFSGSGAHRASFLSDWTPLSQRLEGCKFNIRFRVSKVSRELEALPQQDVDFGHWFKIRTVKQYQFVTLDFGWPVLFEALRGLRSTHKDEQLSKVLGLSEEEEEEDSSRILRDTKGRLNYLPARIWAMVLLTDSLRRWPWTALNGRELKFDSARAFSRLGAAMIKVAYLHIFYRLTKEMSDEILAKTIVSALKEGHSQSESDEKFLYHAINQLDKGLLPNAWLSPTFDEDDALVEAVLSYDLKESLGEQGSTLLSTHLPSLFDSYNEFEKLPALKSLANISVTV